MAFQIIENQELLQGYKEAVDFSSIVTKTDLKGRITYANNNFCKISGYSKDELIGKAHNIVRHPDQSAASFKDLWETIQAKRVWKGVVQNRHKDGGSYYVAATVVPFLDEAGEIVEYISIRQDITELQLLTNKLEERVAEEVEKNQKKEQDLIRHLNLFLDSTPNPIIVLQEEKIKFVNKSFLNLLSTDKESLLDQKYDFSSLLVKSKGYVGRAEDFVLHESNKIAIVTKHGRNIFHLYYEELQCDENKSLKMYTLNNITANEYQKLKINYFNEQLQEYYTRNKISISRAKGTKEEPFPKKQQISKEVRELNVEEKTLLKRKHDNHAVSSHEYSREIDDYILTEIQELGEIEDEINILVQELEDKNLDSMHEVVLRLLKFSSVLSNLMEFKELSFSISSLADLLDAQEITTLDETTYKKMLLFLSNIVLDLSTWRNIVFVQQSANDIHYMDSSLFSSILQLELIFNTSQQHEDEDDFELF